MASFLPLGILPLPLSPPTGLYSICTLAFILQPCVVMCVKQSSWHENGSILLALYPSTISSLSNKQTMAFPVPLISM